MNFNYEEVRAFQLQAGDVIRYQGTQLVEVLSATVSESGKFVRGALANGAPLELCALWLVEVRRSA